MEETFKPNDLNSDIEPNVDLVGSGTIKNTSPLEVAKVIDQLDPKKSPGPDKINTDMMKNLSKRGIAYLTKLINKSFIFKYVPLLWKKANMTMILKPGKPPDNTSSYRPIALLPVLSKIFERIFLTRLKDQITTRKILPDEQYGFREKHGTTEQVHRLVSYITQALEDKEYSPAVFIDVSKAFDKVWHEGLIHKLSNLLPTPYCKLIKEYLQERYFRVKVGTEYSDFTPINAGVPQGSV
jgi:hypothetical protein